MPGTVFVDTNVFIYALDRADLEKRQAARNWRMNLWHTGRRRISFQVLQEFYAKITQKWPSAREHARVEVMDLLAWRPASIDGAIIERGWRIQDRYRQGFWDSLIISAAKALDCRYLLTEDLRNNQEIDGILVINPFLHGPNSVVLS